MSGNGPDVPPAADPLPPPVPATGGVLVLDKPAGISSAGLLNRLKRLFPRKTKLGHAGTLDPFATGVLLALVGRATKRCEELMGSPKGYRTTIKLGATTATLDPESEVMPFEGARVPTLEEVRAVLAGMQGEVMQMPPQFSAMKVGGRRAYDLARAGKVVELVPRPVQVYSMRLVSYSYPLIELEMEVGRGFYVRSLARDMGVALGSAGYLRELRRTRVGPFAAEDAVRPETLTPENVGRLLK